MSLTSIFAKAECDGCGKRIETQLDAATTLRENYSFYSAMLDAFAGGFESSVQGSDQILCDNCTKVVDHFVTADRNANDDEISAALA